MTKILQRHVTFSTATTLVISSMIGTGVFTSLGYQLVDIQSVFTILLLWVVGGVLSLFGALSYSELATALPKSGGEYYLLSRIIHPSLGFVAGFVSATVGFSAPAVLAAIAFANYFTPIFPSTNIVYTAIGVIIFMNLLHGTKLGIGKIFQEWSTFLKIGLISVFILFGFFYADHQLISVMPLKKDYNLIFSPEFAVNLVWVSYAYTGWNSSVYIVGEIINPGKNIFRSILFGTVIVTILYIALNFVFLFVTPMEQLVGKIEVGYLSGVQLFGSELASFVSFCISLLLLSTISSYVYVGPRIIKAIGEDYSKLDFLSKVDIQGIPFNAFILQLIISIIFILTSTFEQVLLYTGIVLIITSTITVVSLFYLRFKEPNLDRPYKVWGYPYTPLFFIILNLWVLYYTFKLQALESFIGLGIMVISFGMYFIIKNDKK